VETYTWDFSPAGRGKSERVEEAGYGGREPFTTLLLVTTGLVPLRNFLREPDKLVLRGPMLHGRKVERRGKGKGEQLPAKHEVNMAVRQIKTNIKHGYLTEKHPWGRAGFLFPPIRMSKRENELAERLGDLGLAEGKFVPPYTWIFSHSA